MPYRRKLTPTMISQLVQCLADGGYVTAACRHVGISEASFYSWMDRARVEVERVEEVEDAQAIIHDAVTGRTLEDCLADCPAPFDPEEWAYVVFASWTTRARGQAETHAVRVIKQAAATDWRAAAWYLSHAHGLRWSEKSGEVETVPAARVGDPVTVDSLEAKLLAVMGPEVEEPRA